MNCTQCGHPLEPHHAFCEECGAVRPQLPAKFAASQQAYFVLKERYERGELSKSEFEAAMQDSMVQDADGVYWMLGAESGKWYRYENDQWVLASPPLIAVASPPSSPPPPPPTTVAPPPPKKNNSKRWLALIAAAVLIGIIGVVVGRYVLAPSDSGQQTALAPTLTPTTAETQATATDSPTATPSPSATATTTPMATPSATIVPTSSTPTTRPVTSTPTRPRPTATTRPRTATPTRTPTRTPTSAPNATPSPPEVGMILDFESDLTWRRGAQPYGEFTLSDEETLAGDSAGRLSYDFPAVTENFVVFEARPEIPLAEETTGFFAWVYGDGSGHYLNIWLRDAADERRSYTFGQISHEGWMPMVALIDEDLGWPNGHIDGPDNGVLDAPFRFHAFVLDGVPDGKASQGEIFLDDISTFDDEATVVVEPTAEPGATPTVEAPTVLSGHIAFPVYAPERGVYDIYIANPDGSAMQRVADYASQPDFSPDGRRLALRGWRDNDRGIAVMDAFGGNRKRLSNFLEDALPSWRPDGQRLVFFSRRESDRKSRIYQVNASGGGDWELQQGGAPVLGEFQSWMPNGQIVYRSVWPDQAIAIMNEDGSGYRPIVKDASATGPAISPDSKWVAFMSQRDGGWEIYKTDTQGKNLTRLTTNGANDGLPTWSPDGRSIAFLSDRNGRWGMWVMDANGNNQRKLFDLPGSPEGYVTNEPGFSSRGWVEERISWGQ